MRSYNPRGARTTSLGYSLFARHYSGNHDCFLFLSLLRCFSSGGWLSACAECHAFSMTGCPIRKPADISLVCSSPQLIAAYRVLRRLSEPRHPPCALNCFKKFGNCRCYLRQIKKLLRITTCYPNMSKSYSILDFWFLIFDFKNLQSESKIWLWRISESNRWPLACKANALASWANPPW
jgi:hypothetical protein